MKLRTTAVEPSLEDLGKGSVVVVIAEVEEQVSLLAGLAAAGDAEEGAGSGLGEEAEHDGGGAIMEAQEIVLQVDAARLLDAGQTKPGA